MTADIATAFLFRNPAGSGEVSDLLNNIHATLTALAGQAAPPKPNGAQKPAVEVADSIKPDHLFCLECGRRLRSLAFHLKSAHGLAPEPYRVKWGLPDDYPMSAPNFKARRSQIAVANGFGHSRKRKRQAGHVA